MEQAEVSTMPLVSRQTTPTKTKQTKKSNTNDFLFVLFGILFLLTAAGLFSAGYSIIQLNKQLNEVKKFIHFKE